MPYPKISVITPVKNSKVMLEKAIKSLITQNYPNLEYIVIDGASTDGTIDIIKKYENFINYWNSKNDNNAVIAANDGIKIASGEIICFLNADDFYEPQILMKIAEEFTKNPQLDIVSCRYRVLEMQNDELKTIEETKLEQMEIDKNRIIVSYGINARFFRKNIFEKYGMMLAFDDKNRTFISNDIEYLIRLTLHEIKNKTIDYIGYNYLSHKKSNTFSKNIETVINLYEDKIFIAKKFLNSDYIIPKIWQKTFKKWIKKYRAKTAMKRLGTLNFKEFFKNYSFGIKEVGFLNFSFYFFKTLLRN